MASFTLPVRRGLRDSGTFGLRVRPETEGDGSGELRRLRGGLLGRSIEGISVLSDWQIKPRIAESSSIGS